MALTLVQHKTNSSTANANTVAVTVTALGSGNLIVVAVAGGIPTDTVSSITDNGGSHNTYTQVASARATTTAGRFCDLWYAKNSNSGATSVTATVGNTSTVRKVIEVWEVSGANTSSPLDGNGVATNNGAQSGTVATATGITTTNANDFIAAFCRTNGAVASEHDGTFTLNDITGGSNGASSVIVSSTGTYTPAWNDNSGTEFCASIAAFKQASASSRGLFLDQLELNGIGVGGSFFRNPIG